MPLGIPVHPIPNSLISALSEAPPGGAERGSERPVTPPVKQETFMSGARAPETRGESSSSTLRSEDCGWGSPPHTLALLAPGFVLIHPGPRIPRDDVWSHPLAGRSIPKEW